MPAVYDSLGVKFMYPENWTLEDGVDDENTPDEAADNCITVYSPGGAFWSLSIYPPNRSTTDLVAEVLRAMRSEYDQLDAETVTTSIEGQDLVGYDMNFVYLDLISTAVVRGLTTPRAAYVIYYQAEDRELVGLQSVFDAMTVSLLRGMDAAPV